MIVYPLDSGKLLTPHPAPGSSAEKFVQSVGQAMDAAARVADNDLATFSTAMSGELAAIFGHMPNTAETCNKISQALDHAFAALNAVGSRFVPFSGCQLIGATAKVSALDPHAVELAWRTDFYPHPRYRTQHDGMVPLGFHEQYDLYFAPQAGLPGTLIARSDDDPSHDATYNSNLLGIAAIYADPSNIARAFVEANTRAGALGYVADTR